MHESFQKWARENRGDVHEKQAHIETERSRTFFPSNILINSISFIKKQLTDCFKKQNKTKLEPERSVGPHLTPDSVFRAALLIHEARNEMNERCVSSPKHSSLNFVTSFNPCNRLE